MGLRKVALAALVASAAMAAVGSGHATAQPVHDWSGTYAGLFAGYGWGRAQIPAPYDSTTGFWYNWTGSPYRADVDGFLAGAVVGHNWQRHAFVFGLEAEAGYFGLDGSAIDPNGAPGLAPWLDTKTRVRSDFYGALSARAGIAQGPVLIYLKGGLAVLNARASTVDDFIAPPGNTSLMWMSGSRFMVGWLLGGGLEWALASGWSVRAEYAFADFGRIETSGSPVGLPNEIYRQRISVTAHTARLGVSYRFNGPPRL